MKPHVVQAPGLAGLKYFLPGSNIGGWITSEREVATVVSAAKHDRPAIEDKFFSDGAQLAQSNLQVVILFKASSL